MPKRLHTDKGVQVERERVDSPYVNRNGGNWLDEYTIGGFSVDSKRVEPVLINFLSSNGCLQRIQWRDAF